MPARPALRPDRSMAARTAEVQSPSSGWRTVSTAKPCAVGARLPFQHRRGVIVFQHDDARAARDRHQLCGRRHAVADRGDQRDVGGIGVDEARGGDARALVLAAGKAGIERPGSALAADGGAARLPGFSAAAGCRRLN